MREKSSAAGKSVGAEFMQLIEQIGREKGIDVEILVAALEDAITTASRKAQERAHATTSRKGRSTEPTPEILVCRLNRKTGELQLYARKLIVEKVVDPSAEISLAESKAIDATAQPGGHVEIPRSTKGLGRIEAQAAKQVIFHKVREAERDIVYAEYVGKVGELVNGTVKRFERGDIIVELGRTEALLPRRNQSRSEMYSQGDRVRAIVVELSRISKGPQVVLSRTEPSLLTKLFEMEVPEIYDGTVTLRQAVREPGERAKVAVSSREKDVDPVGACVGMKGSRVQAIIRELRGEKIDIVQWSEDIIEFASNALNPARVSRVSVRPDLERTLEVVVDEQQLSLAIGKKGQNVRLGSKLLGWRIDIKSEEDKRREVEREMAEMALRCTLLAEVPGLDGAAVATLAKQGVETVDQLLVTPPDSIALDADTAASIVTKVEDFLREALAASAPHVADDETAPNTELTTAPTAPAAGVNHD